MLQLSLNSEQKMFHYKSNLFSYRYFGQFWQLYYLGQTAARMCTIKKGIIENCTKFTRKQLCQTEGCNFGN